MSVGIVKVLENFVEQGLEGVPYIIIGAFILGFLLALYFVSLLKQRAEPGGDQQVKPAMLVITFLCAGLFMGGSFWIYVVQETVQNKSTEQIGQENLKKVKDKL